MKKQSQTVRATFSLPCEALDEIAVLREKLAKDGHILNKSELIRAGIVALSALSQANARKAIKSVDRLKAGRPKAVR